MQGSEERLTRINIFQVQRLILFHAKLESLLLSICFRCRRDDMAGSRLEVEVENALESGPRCMLRRAAALM
jgi:hypothetical protein